MYPARRKARKKLEKARFHQIENDDAFMNELIPIDTSRSPRRRNRISPTLAQVLCQGIGLIAAESERRNNAKNRKNEWDEPKNSEGSIHVGLF